MVEAAHQPPRGGANPGLTERQFGARRRIGVRAALAQLASSVGVLLREIRYAREVTDLADSARVAGRRHGGAANRLRPEFTAAKPAIFERSGPPQAWLDYVAAHDPVWIGDHDVVLEEPLTEPARQPERGPSSGHGWPPRPGMHRLDQEIAPAPERPARVQRLTDQLLTAVVTRLSRAGSAAPHELSPPAQRLASQPTSGGADLSVPPVREPPRSTDPIPTPRAQDRPAARTFGAGTRRRLVPIPDPSPDPATVDHDEQPSRAPWSSPSVSRKRSGAPRMLPSDSPISFSEVESGSSQRDHVARADGAVHLDPPRRTDRGPHIEHDPHIDHQLEPAERQPPGRPTRPVDHASSRTADHDPERPPGRRDQPSQARPPVPPRRRAEVEERSDRWPSLLEPQPQTEDLASESGGTVSSIWRALERDALDPTITQQRRR